MERQEPERLTPEQAVHRYSDMVYHLAFSQMKTKHDADDVYQEVFLRYFRSAPEFESEEHRKAWLLRVTLNCCKSQWSAPWRKRTAALEEEIPFPEPEDRSLREALLRLPGKYRAVVHLFYYEDLRIDQVAQVLGRKESTVRTQLTRARRLLKQYLEEE